MHLRGQTERDAELCAARLQTTTSGTLAVQCSLCACGNGAWLQGPLHSVRRVESTAASIQLIERQHPEILDLARDGAAACGRHLAVEANLHTAYRVVPGVRPRPVV